MEMRPKNFCAYPAEKNVRNFLTPPASPTPLVFPETIDNGRCPRCSEAPLQDEEFFVTRIFIA